jgi:ribonuclease BN (tRNA processing enzyme)
MKLTILGSGTNVHPRRAAAGYLVQTDRPFLLDLGPRTLMNLLKTGVDRHQIRHILFSHYHADHVSDFITFFFDAAYHSRYVRTRAPLTLIGPPGTTRLFRSILGTFPSFTAAAFSITLREVTTRPFRIGRTRIIPRPVLHSRGLPCLGYRIEYGGRVLAYSGDSQYCRSVIRLCRQADVAVLDCSFPADRPGPGHMHAGECGQVAREAGVRRLILSHFYPVADQANVRLQARRQYRGTIVRGKDLMTVSISTSAGGRRRGSQ